MMPDDVHCRGFDGHQHRLTRLEAKLLNRVPGDKSRQRHPAVDRHARLHTPVSIYYPMSSSVPHALMDNFFCGAVLRRDETMGGQRQRRGYSWRKA
jgi:hypothetical protein